MQKRMWSRLGAFTRLSSKLSPQTPLLKSPNPHRHPQPLVFRLHHWRHDMVLQLHVPQVATAPSPFPVPPSHACFLLQRGLRGAGCLPLQRQRPSPHPAQCRAAKLVAGAQFALQNNASPYIPTTPNTCTVFLYSPHPTSQALTRVYREHFNFSAQQNFGAAGDRNLKPKSPNTTPQTNAAAWPSC